MAGEVTAKPWRTGAKNRWEVYVPPELMPNGTKTAGDRKVVTAYSRTEALAWGKERRTQLIEEHRRRQRGSFAAKKPRVMTFTHLVMQLWLPHLRVLCAQQMRKPSSIEAVESVFKIHVEPFIGGKPINEITNAVMSELIRRWLEGGYPGPKGKPVKATSSPKTLNNRKTIVNAALKYAVEQSIIPLMPCRIAVKHVETEEAEHYDEKVYEQLLAGAVEVDLRTYVAVLLGGDAGLRRGEILALNVEDVQSSASSIMIRRSVYWERKGARRMIETLPKGKKIKSVAATARLMAALRKLVGSRRSGRVLLDDERGQVTPKMLRVWVRRAEKQAKLAQTGCLHVLRHSHLTHLADAGASLLEIASQARHSDLRVTQRYLHRSAGSARAAVDLLERKRAAGH
jgi:integrase